MCSLLILAIFSLSRSLSSCFSNSVFSISISMSFFKNILNYSLKSNLKYDLKNLLVNCSCILPSRSNQKQSWSEIFVNRRPLTILTGGQMLLTSMITNQKTWLSAWNIQISAFQKERFLVNLYWLPPVKLAVLDSLLKMDNTYWRKFSILWRSHFYELLVLFFHFFFFSKLILAWFSN